MDFADQVAVVTGAGQGIGRAICEMLAAQGAKIVVSDRDSSSAARVAEQIGGFAISCDVSDPDQIANLVAQTNDKFGRIDIFISNAGFASGEPDGATSATDEHWQNCWNVHVMAHLRAARLILPQMKARNSGYLVNIASAAGLLTQIGDAAYSASKHAAVSLAQSLAIDHGGNGVHVAVVCPLYVATPLLGYEDKAHEAPPESRILSPNDVAQSLLNGLQESRFLILPHPEAAIFASKRMDDCERWIAGMRKVRNRVAETSNGTSIQEWHKLI